jgi:hypothetical protein
LGWTGLAAVSQEIRFSFVHPSRSAVDNLLFADEPAWLTPNGDHELGHSPEGQSPPYFTFALSPVGLEHNPFGVTLIHQAYPVVRTTE